ncbi:AIPR family protein [Sessilibacter corallicola]|uniref:Abortive phage infection protein C-terminal domain-containing protein n=1 Tax=Sessilibacter corallicola TaxID=2904075 RepID=A0ABQ0A9B5_9GAMM
MKHEEFYNLIDIELEKVIENSIEENILEKLKQDHQRKSYGFMVWFLKFYAGIENISDYITDGHGDNSCDIILDKTNSQNEKVFYLIQSKWNKISNCNREFDSELLKSYLSDVHSILRGDKKKTENELFNSRYGELISHIRQNGEVKVIYLSLNNNCKEIDENIRSIEKAFGEKVKVQAFDINQLKLDFIDRIYKKSNPPNPLEKIYSPEYEKIQIDIEREHEANHLVVEKPFEAHVFNIKPKTIFNLVRRYGVSLFNKNVRNPLVSSYINEEIRTSLMDNPSYFWYYNNGITAITRAIPVIGTQARSFEVTGLQVINGAQTAYSIYQAYLEATHEQREVIDAEARITLRLLKSGGSDFDLKVTKYTNSQNPVSERDFWSNHEIQEKIQKYFYETNVWYEKRSGEFRKTPKGIVSLPNSFVANAHLAFWLSDPISVFKSTISREHRGIDLIFTSHKADQDGLYEKIFNKETNPKHVFASFAVFDTLTNVKGFNIENIWFTNGFHILALSKIVLRKYLTSKYGAKANLSEFIYKIYHEDSGEILAKALGYSSKIMHDEIEEVKGESQNQKFIKNLMTKNSHFDLLFEKVESFEIDAETIENVTLAPESEIQELDQDQIEEMNDSTLH